MAFLHRVINGGGVLKREYAIGSGRMDLCLRYGDSFGYAKPYGFANVSLHNLYLFTGDTPCDLFTFLHRHSMSVSGSTRRRP